MHDRIVLWRAVKVIPRVCPNPQCRQPFERNGQGGYFLRFYWRELPVEQAQAFAAAWHWPAFETHIVDCSVCHNTTLLVTTECHPFVSKAEARKLKREGFLVHPIRVARPASEFRP